MTRIFTVSSGGGTPNTECNAWSSQGLSGATATQANGARTAPRSEMLAAPSTKAVQILAGGPGRSAAATTSQRINSAGATAAVPITVGRDARRFIWMAYMPFYWVGAVYWVGTVPP